MFPVLHKPTFLQAYEDFVADPAKVKNTYNSTQLYLVFSIAGLSSENPDLPQLAACEKQWTKSLEGMLMDNTMCTLQCLLLAIMYCTVAADHRRLQHYKAIAVTLSHRLGLHHSQERFSFGALTTETRKKVFWTLYTLDWYVVPDANNLSYTVLTVQQFHCCYTWSTQTPEKRRCTGRVPIGYR